MRVSNCCAGARLHELLRFSWFLDSRAISSFSFERVLSSRLAFSFICSQTILSTFRSPYGTTSRLPCGRIGLYLKRLQQGTVISSAQVGFLFGRVMVICQDLRFMLSSLPPKQLLYPSVPDIVWGLCQMPRPSQELNTVILKRRTSNCPLWCVCHP